MSFYQQSIREEIARLGHIGIDPRHVEGYMRLEHSTLDGLSKKQFSDEVKIGIECTLADGEANAERNARSYGL
jgi:hypothetical protein